MGMNKIYGTKYLVPAVILKHQPALKRWVKFSHRRGEIYIQWRWPWSSGP